LTRLLVLGSVSWTCRPVPRFPWSPAFAPPTPRRIAPPCSPVSQLLCQSVTPRARSSSATALHLPDTDRRSGEAARPNTRSPGSLNTESLRTCQVLRPRRTGRALAMTRPQPMLPSARTTASASGIKTFRSSMAGLCAPLPTLRACARTARGTTRFATPSSLWTFTIYSLPVSRRIRPRLQMRHRPDFCPSHETNRHHVEFTNSSGVENAVIGQSPICHTRESGYPVGHDEAAQDSVADAARN
jgi:hypothetical protein